MLFHSIDFVIFFPIVVLGFFLIPEKWKNLWLLIASYYFYMNWNAKYALLLFGASAITYAGALLIDRINGHPKKQKMVLVVALVIIFACLGYYKYTNFMIQTINRLAVDFGYSLEIPKFDIILPVGISFFTFQAAGYLIDVYRGDVEVERNPFRYLLFVSFFPQLVAGPIERSKNLLRQMYHHAAFDSERARHGLCIMLWGYFLKLVIADRCAVIVDSVYSQYETHGFALLFLAAVCFSIQIYCDFMGYSTIARGAALVLGYELMDNFHQPYFATSIQEFWRRWHISLSTWFKDYLYIPLGGNRCSKFRHYVNLMITFLVSGLWHGASWAFVAWGGMHGLFQIIGSIVKPARVGLEKMLHIPTESWPVKLVRMLWTDLLVVFAWIFFRTESMYYALHYIRQMITGGLRWNEMVDGTFYNQGLNPFHTLILVISLLLLLGYSILREKQVSVYDWLVKQPVLVRYGVYWGFSILITFSLSLTGQEFIYFQF